MKVIERVLADRYGVPAGHFTSWYAYLQSSKFGSGTAYVAIAVSVMMVLAVTPLVVRLQWGNYDLFWATYVVVPGKTTKVELIGSNLTKAIRSEERRVGKECRYH